MKRFRLACAFLLAGVALAGPVKAQTVTLRLSHWLPPQHPIAAKSLVPWTQSITEASGGTIKFEVFPAGQLGKPEDHFDLARDGIADVAWLNPGFNAGRFPVFAAVQVPMMVSDGRGGMVAVNSWYAKYAPTEMREAKFCLSHMLAPLIFHTTKRIERPADLSGMKIRPSSAMEAAFIRNAGGATVPGGNPEAREMISRGVIDGTTGVVGSQFVFGVTDVTKFHLDVPFSAVSFVLVINKDKYNAMTDKQKSAIDTHCNSAAAVKFFTAPQAFEEEGFAKLRGLKDGREVVTPSPAALAEWRAAREQVRQSWAKDLAGKGGQPDAVMDELRNALRSNNALVE
jgi:TRAP-type C4-dicarboxylate transport system substrate-binding protein